MTLVKDGIDWDDPNLDLDKLPWMPSEEEWFWSIDNRRDNILDLLNKKCNIDDIKNNVYMDFNSSWNADFIISGEPIGRIKFTEEWSLVKVDFVVSWNACEEDYGDSLFDDELSNELWQIQSWLKIKGLWKYMLENFLSYLKNRTNTEQVIFDIYNTKIVQIVWELENESLISSSDYRGDSLCVVL